jgi:TonB family protein
MLANKFPAWFKSVLAVTNIVAALEQLRTDNRQQTQVISGCAILAANLGWLIALNNFANEPGYLPWFSTLVVVSLVILGKLVIEPQPNTSDNKNETTFQESLALTYSVSSILLCAVFIQAHAPIAKKVVLEQQLVEIELSSPLDAENRQQILPGTKAKQLLHRRTSPDKLALQGSAISRNGQTTAPMHLASAVAQLAAVNTKTQEGKRIDKTILAAPRQVTSTMASSLKITISPTTQNQKIKSNSLELEEVPPPELMEVLNNDGDLKSTDVWEPGGNSTDGKGRKTLLVAYLQELHRLIKLSWVPPRGISSSAKILFRIKHSGELVSVKLLHSSGNTDADAAAANAITACVPLKPLPSDYSLEYLDVCYTFNYTTDQLTEVVPQIVR